MGSPERREPLKKNSASSVPRKQEQQRKKEYQQEIKEMHRRVKGRPLLLEQVAQVSDISVGSSPQTATFFCLHSSHTSVCQSRILTADFHTTGEAMIYSKV